MERLAAGIIDPVQDGVRGQLGATIPIEQAWERPLAPGEEGLTAIEMINGIIRSGKTGRKVSVPVDRAEYATLMADLQASSKFKTDVVEIRETDPKHVQ